MDHPVISFTAVYLRAKHGYVGFVEELPGVNSHGQTIEEARANLQRLAAVIFDRGARPSQGTAGGKGRGARGFYRFRRPDAGPPGQRVTPL